MKTRINDARAFIVTNGWLAACPADFREWMAGNLQWRGYAPGEGISHAGDAEGALHCVGDGQVSFVAGLGAEDIGTSYFGLAGTWWGLAPLLGGKRVGSVKAETRALCGSIPISLLRARLAEHPGDWRVISLNLSEVFVVAAGAHADLLIPDSRRRVAATILRLAGHRHRVFRMQPPTKFACTQEQLAGATALSRNTVGKLLRDFEAEGLLEARYGQIDLRDAAGLAAIAGSP
jgi:CRP-like cAMP-binding protein